MQEIHISQEKFLQMSVQNFLKLYPNEEACLSLFPISCRRCRSKVATPETANERKFTCSMCKSVGWRTAGTFFHGLVYLQASLLAIWLYEDRAVFSKSALSKIARIAYSTAWEIDEKVREIINLQMNRDVNLFELLTTTFDPVICRRSSLTPDGEHPRLEGLNSLDTEEPEINSEEQKKIYETLSDQPQTIDKIHQDSGLPVSTVRASLTILELIGYVNRQYPDKYFVHKSFASRPTNLNYKQRTAIASFFKYIRPFHGVSRKYLQRYTATFWSTIASHRWSEQNLLKTCMPCRRSSRQEILAYNSPPMVRLFAA